MTRKPNTNQEGSALLLAVFVAALLSALGIALLHLGELNLKMNRAALSSKKSFYLAESGVEKGRRVLYDANGGADNFGPALEAATGGNDTLEFDPDQLQAQYDSDGNVIGIISGSDDQPLIDPSILGEGFFAAYLTNDPIDHPHNLTDTNSRAMVTGVGAGPNRSFRIVEAIVEPHILLPPMPPAAITLVGSGPLFDGGSSGAEQYDGEDCHFLGGGIPGLNLPIVGGTGPDAEDDIEAGMDPPDNYNSGGYSGDETGVDLLNDSDPIVADGLGPMDPIWTDCNYLQELLEHLAQHATFYCDPAISCTPPVPTAMDDVTFIDGDITLGPGFIGAGVLIVTGELTFTGNSDFTGIVLAIGEGSLIRSGGGNGVISGTTFLADIAGPNGVYGDADDCTGDGPGDTDLFGQASYLVNGGGNSDIDYCSRFANINPPSYRVVDFRQR